MAIPLWGEPIPSDRLDTPPITAPSVDEVIAWLRLPGGSLQERMMKRTAADLLEMHATDDQ